MRTVNHDALPPSVRDHGALQPHQDDPIAAFEKKLTATRARVAQLTTEKERADKRLALATAEVSAGGDAASLFDLGLAASQLANDLATAREALSDLEELDVATKKERAQFRLKQKVGQARAARDEFQKLYLQAALALGRWHALAGEVCQLTTTAADRFPNGHLYYPPELLGIGTEMNTDPNPRAQLREAGYRENSGPGFFREHIPLVPLRPPEQEEQQ